MDAARKNTKKRRRVRLASDKRSLADQLLSPTSSRSLSSYLVGSTSESAQPVVVHDSPAPTVIDEDTLETLRSSSPPAHPRIRDAFHPASKRAKPQATPPPPEERPNPASSSRRPHLRNVSRNEAGHWPNLSLATIDLTSPASTEIDEDTLESVRTPPSPEDRDRVRKGTKKQSPRHQHGHQTAPATLGLKALSERLGRLRPKATETARRRRTSAKKRRAEAPAPRRRTSAKKRRAEAPAPPVE